MASQVTAYRSANEPKSDCESSSNHSSDGELPPSSDTDNDEVFSVNKRRKVEVSSSIKQQVVDHTVVPVKATIKRNLNMWSQVLHNQNSDEITKKIVNSTVDGKAITARGPEFYSRPRFQRHHKVSENDSSPAPIHKTVETIVKGKIENFTIGRTRDTTEETGGQPNNNKRKNRKRNKNGGGKNFKPPSQERFRGNHTNVPIYPMGKKVILKKKKDLTADLSVDEIAFEIAYRLWEQKRHLVVKMVEFLGNEKAISICVRTEAIESNGGMATHKGNRRRTPGGVFIRLAQMDTEVEQEGFQKLLDSDNPMSPNMRQNLKRKRNRNNNKQAVPTTTSPSTSSVGDVSITTNTADDSGLPSTSSSSINDITNDDDVPVMEVDVNNDVTSATTSSTNIPPQQQVDTPVSTPTSSILVVEDTASSVDAT